MGSWFSCEIKFSSHQCPVYDIADAVDLRRSRLISSGGEALFRLLGERPARQNDCEASSVKRA